jgi:periplasmic divalent cation tolerance protein
MDIVICFVTAPSQEVAAALGKSLVDRRLAACVSIVPGVQSIYRWNDDVTIDQEVLMILKTDASLAEELQRAVLAEHPYDVPEFVALSPQQVAPQYAAWVTQSTKG